MKNRKLLRCFLWNIPWQSTWPSKNIKNNHWPQSVLLHNDLHLQTYEQYKIKLKRRLLGVLDRSGETTILSTIETCERVISTPIFWYNITTLKSFYSQI